MMQRYSYNFEYANINQSFSLHLTCINKSDSFVFLYLLYLCINNKIKVMGLNIKKAIKSKGLEVKEVAKRMGITPTGLSQHINGNPSIEVLYRISDAIGCDVSELFEQPKKDNLSITCPHCGKDIEIKVTDRKKEVQDE
nr:MAG TPA: helix-turn-helix domain protein [Caudoviricetes sp.]